MDEHPDWEPGSAMKRRVFLLTGILLAITFAATGLAILLLYNTSLGRTMERFRESAQSQARLIEQIAEHEGHFGDLIEPVRGHGSAFEATMRQVREAHLHFTGFGRTGEFQLARIVGDSIVFLLAHRRDTVEVPSPVALTAASLAQPMRRALAGMSGSMVGADYQGHPVVAAYEPVNAFGRMGIVTKMDVAEARAPYVRAALGTVAAALVLAAAGAGLFFSITNPMLRRLAESEERFRIAFDNSAVGKLMTGLDGRLLRVNKAFADMLGYSVAELQIADFRALTHPDDVAMSNEHMTRGKTGTAREVHFEKRYLRKDGGITWVELSAVLLRDDAGRPRHFVADVVDITARRQAEEQRVRLNNQLRLKNEELEQLIYAASHDLRTPLVGVQGFVGELRRSLDQLRPGRSGDDTAAEQDIYESLKFIESGVSRMDVLLSGLLRLSRLGRASLNAEALDVNQVVAEVLRSLEFAVRQAGAHVEADDLPACRADAALLTTVFANLVDNALKYRDASRPTHVRITGRTAGDSTEYGVEDNGPGIEPEFHKKVFEPFFQVDPKHSRGDGLGLTIVKRTVGRLGGRVWLESAVGQGTRVFFSLPRPQG